MLGTKHLTMRSGEARFMMASRALARSMLFRHLSKLPFAVHVFDNLKDPLWVQYTLAKKVYGSPEIFRGRKLKYSEFGSRCS